MESISHETGEEFDSLLRLQYMTIVSSAAQELGVEGVYYVDQFNNIRENLDEFIRITSGVVARIRLRGSSGHDGLSVRLANRTKGIIEDELAKVRTAVINSELEDDSKKRLFKKIEDFRSELHKDRLRFGPSMAILGAIAAGVVGTTTLLADAPSAVTTIISLIGKDKELEDTEMKRLGPTTPKMLIEDQSRDPSEKTSRYRKGDDLDDDIPF